MGRDKAWLDLGGTTMIERIIDAVGRVTSGVALIANGPEYDRLGLPVFRDENRGVGPIEAIRVALSRSPTRYALVVGCDLPFVTPELLAYLLDAAEGHQAAIPLDGGGRLEPLCAVYSTEALEAVTRLIGSGVRKVSRLLDVVPARLVEFREFSHLSGSDLFFTNINTPDEYARALEAVRKPKDC